MADLTGAQLRQGVEMIIRVTPAKIAVVAAVAVLYNSWVWAPVVAQNPALTGYLSELAALDQPGSGFFRIADVLAALGVAGIALAGTRRWRDWLGAGAKWTAGALAAFAAFTILDAIFPMPCATTFDAACKARESANFFAPEFFVHTVASTLVGASILVSIAAVWWVRRSPLVLGVGVVIAGAMALTVVIAFTVGSGHGWWQALQVLATSAWFGYLVIHLDARAVTAPDGNAA